MFDPSEKEKARRPRRIALAGAAPRVILSDGDACSQHGASSRSSASPPQEGNLGRGQRPSAEPRP